LRCGTCGVELAVYYYIDWDEERACGEADCYGTMTVDRIDECNRCGEPFTPDDPHHVVTKDGEVVEMGPIEVHQKAADVPHVHEGCTDGYDEWVRQELA